MERTAQKAGVQVGDNQYADLDYADDVMLMAEQTESLRSALVEFRQTAENLGLHLSWQKTKIQNLGSGDPVADIAVGDNIVEAVTEFRYLRSIQSSSGRCYPDLHRHIGVASSAMHSMQCCWRQHRLSLGTKLRLYQTCILRMLLYGADTWTLLADDTCKLQSFHMGCQRQILGIKWQGHMKNVDIAAMTGPPNIADVIGKRRHALFGHVVRLDATTPAHQALKQVIATKAGHRPGTNWRRPPGRPRKTWIQQIGDGTPAS